MEKNSTKEKAVGLAADKLTSAQRRAYIRELEGFRSSFRLALDQGKRGKSSAGPVQEQLGKCSGLLRELCAQCGRTWYMPPVGATAGLAGGGPLLGTAALPAAFLQLRKALAGQKISDRELNQQLMSMLQVTISMLEELNVSEERIQTALQSTMEAVQDIKAQYGGEVDGEMLAKLVQDACADKIRTDVQEDADFFACREQVVHNLGRSAWEKMSGNARLFLVDAVVLYEQLKGFGDFDYSAVCLTASKALEVEVTRRYFTGFADFLKREAQEIPQGMRRKNGQVMRPEDFMLGSVTDVTGYGVNASGTVFLVPRYREDSALFVRYGREDLFCGQNAQGCTAIIRQHVAAIHQVRTRYRNPSAHKSRMTSGAAKECLDYLVDVQRTLGIILDDCRW